MKSLESPAVRAVGRAIDRDPSEELAHSDGQPITSFDANDLRWYADERDPAFIESIARGRVDAAASRGMAAEELIRERETRDAIS